MKLMELPGLRMTTGYRKSSSPPAVAAPDVALAIDGLEKRFGKVVAVKGASFEVRRGELLSLLGPSGSGKSTILRVIGGLEYPTAGRISLNGRDIQKLPPYRRNIGVVFQKYALFPHMTAAENIEFPLTRRGIDREDRKQRVADVLALVGLADLGNRYPSQLSGGQEQRVALARAIVFKPEVLLLDEPLGALDKQLRERMQREIRSLQTRLRITTIFITHDQTEAMAMSDRIAVINHGVIEQIGSPEALYERPLTEFVAGFVGESNLLPCAVLGIADGWADVQLSETVVVKVPAGDHTAAAKALLVRPEKISIATTLDRHDANAVRCIISAKTYLGDATAYTLVAGPLTLTAKHPHRDDGPQHALGSEVMASWRPHNGVLVS